MLAEHGGTPADVAIGRAARRASAGKPATSNACAARIDALAVGAPIVRDGAMIGGGA